MCDTTVDCWDGPNGEPQITHGHTLTSKVPLRDVIEAISRYAFAASPFPLILSLEIHTEVIQQSTIANILRSILGEKLLDKPLEDTSSDLVALPSPRDLTGKILVKAKNLLVTQVLHPEGAGESNNDATQIEALIERSNTSTTDTTESESDSILSNAREFVRSVRKGGKLRRRDEKDGKTSKERVLMAPELASLLVYTVGVKHRGLSKNEKYAVEHMFSLSERSALKYARSTANGPNRDDLAKHNRTHLTRIYPSMNSYARLSYSANFLPNVFWSMGCQLVAVNWQTLDLGFEMNQALFSRNGRSGYVLKPKALRLKDALRPASKSRIRIEVRLISGQQLPRSRDTARGKDSTDGDPPVLDPFVTVAVLTPERSDYSVCVIRSDSKRIDSHASDPAKADHDALGGPTAQDRSHAPWPTTARRSLVRQRTSAIPRNGFNPIWNETLHFGLEVPGTSPSSSTTRGSGGTSAGIGTRADNAQVQRSSTHPSKASTDIADQQGNEDDGMVLTIKTGGLLDLCFLRFEVRDEGGQYHSITSSLSSTAQAPPSKASSSSRQVASSGAPPASMEAPPADVPAPSAHGNAASGHCETVSSNEAPTERPSSLQSPARPVTPMAPPPTRSQPLHASTSSSTSEADVRDDAPLVGTYMVPLGALQQGYHHVPLYDAQLNQHLFSTLFVHTRMTILHDEHDQDAGRR